MGTFSQIVQGSYARREIELELDGQKVRLDVRVLRPDEEADVIADAIAYAKRHGHHDAKPGDTLYELGIWIHTAAKACVDHDSPKDDPKPFFDRGAEQIIQSKLITRMHLAYLYEQQETWQSECSPYERIMGDAELMARTQLVAQGDARPFVALPPYMRWLFVHGLASQLVSLREEKSRAGSRWPNPSDEGEEPVA